MSVEAVFVGVILLAGLSLSVAWPWLRQTSPGSPSPLPALGEGKGDVEGRGEGGDPRQEYESLVAAIRRLDFDYQIGVVAEEDYLPQRQALAGEAVVLMQEMDQQASDVAGLELEVEAAVEALRASVEQPVQTDSTARALEDEIEAAVQALRRRRRGVATARVDHGCPACGGRLNEVQHVSPGDRFCAMCGARLGLFCRRCGRAAEPDDRFCGGCGLALIEEANAVALRQH